MSFDRFYKISRRRLLYMLGFGAAGAVIGVDQLFAKQFARETTPVKLPDMVYDPDLQVMVDPVTRKPLYTRAEMVAAERSAIPEPTSTPPESPSPYYEPSPKATPKPLPTVTAGCSDCPKCDDNCG